MLYGTISGTGKDVSRLVLGSTSLSMARLDQGLDLLDEAFAAGCTCIDTAHIYGNGDCERVIGRWLAARPGVREKMVIATKGAHHNQERRRVTPADIASDLHESLERLQTDYVDIYLLHRDDPALPVGPIVDALNEHVAAGRIRALGASNWTHQRIFQAATYAYERSLKHFVVTSPHMSLLQIASPPWEGYVSLSGPEAAAGRKYHLEHRIPVFAWSSLCSGLLSGKYDRARIEAMAKPEWKVKVFGGPDNIARMERATELGGQMGLTLAQVGIAFLLNQPIEVFPLVGCRTGKQYADLAKACGVKLTSQQLAWLDDGESKTNTTT